MAEDQRVAVLGALPASIAMLPAPPGRLSTTTCCFHASVSLAPISREENRSYLGANGTTRRIGLLG